MPFHRFILPVVPPAVPSFQVARRSFRPNQRRSLRSTRQINSATPLRYEPVGSTLRLPSGRILGYHTSGDPNGIPVIYIHGNPDSGIQVTGELEAKVAKKLGILWIGPDRPGIGLSTMYEGQQVSHYSQDLQFLVDHLSLKQYYILGTSGGTGFALACARDLILSQLRGVGICAGIGPVDCGFDSMGETIKKAWDIWRDYPTEMEAYFEAEYVPLARSPDPGALRARMEADFKSWFTGEDLEHVLREEAFATAVQGYRQIYAQGARAHAKGIELNQRSWNFKLEDISFPGIKLWYGGEDVSTTPTMGRYMADRLTQSVYKEYKGKTHLTIWNEECLEGILRDLLEVDEL